MFVSDSVSVFICSVKFYSAFLFYLVELWAFAAHFWFCFCCEYLQRVSISQTDEDVFLNCRCFFFLFLFACIFFICSALSSLSQHTIDFYYMFYFLRHLSVEKIMNYSNSYKNSGLNKTERNWLLQHHLLKLTISFQIIIKIFLGLYVDVTEMNEHWVQR